MTWRQSFSRSAPFVLIHAVLLFATARHAHALLPANAGTLGFTKFLAFHSRELVLLSLAYGLAAKWLGRWSLAVSTFALVVLTTLGGLYFVVTVKTRVVYGGSYLLDELVPFAMFYGPSYVTLSSSIFALCALLTLTLLPSGFFFLGKRTHTARAMTEILAAPFVILGLVGWLMPMPRGIPEYLSRGPLQLLAEATVRDVDYQERSSQKLAEVDRLLDASLESRSIEPLPLLTESTPFHKVILYQMEGVSGRLFQPDSDYGFLLPRLAQWSEHAIQFPHHYTLSTLTFHSYQILNIGGYIRSGSRLETVQAGSLSLVAPLARAGFETAFFSAADLYYRGTTRFLEGLGYQTVMHFPDFSTSYARNGKLIDDRALTDAFRDWAKGKDRFFAVIDAMGTHHPYWNPEGDFLGDWQGNSQLRNYLNALHYQDKILGELIDYVDRDHPDALVIVLSDHGIREYFNEIERADSHEEAFVASFETRFNVPLYFYNRRAFLTRVRSQRSTSHVDVLPTVLDLMGVEGVDRPLGGSSLLSDRQRVHFLNTQHNLDVLGLLDGRHKFLLERETGEKRLYALSDAGDWERVEATGKREHYQELVTSWYRYLTE